ncbi:MAG: L,D-transpeptidase family protein [Rhodobacteraceae bacterium]|nr:L,D-transpeptidase family protein [Paracoccaceae bacterium]
MTVLPNFVAKRTLPVLLAGSILLSGILSQPAMAQITAFKQAVAEAASTDEEVAAFYRTNKYTPIWTGSGPADLARRAALMRALAAADTHGLPAHRYDAAGLMAQMRDVRTTRDLGMVEVALSQALVTYARDIQSGILVPSKIDDGLVRKVNYKDRADYLVEISQEDPNIFMNSLAPQNREYTGLMKQKLRLERLVADGGWGPKVPSGKFKPGQTGKSVIALRNRLISLGYMGNSATQTYDSDIQKAVQKFQLEHGLEADGVAGKITVDEINVTAQARLKSVIVAMERERWLMRERGERHVLVNQTDFSAAIIDDDKVTFRTRSVIGKNRPDRRSPEFSDTMEHMVVNPSWYVPRSIITKEYLPQLKNNPGAAGHLVITDGAGRRVDRANIDFTQYSARNFPFDMRQPPSTRNALGLVKFIFPNKHNIYLHDTPQKHLFARESRAYSHGCIRLAQPFDFAYTLLAKQSDDPKGYFHSVLNTGQETKVKLEQPIPIHLIYRTAITMPRGGTEYRRDVYGRDAKIWSALADAGVVLSDVQG